MPVRIVIAIVFAVLSLLPQSLPAQENHEESLDFRRIRQRAVRELVRRENVRTAEDFQQLSTSCYSGEDSLGYQTDLRTYVVREPLSAVWSRYNSLTPEKAWGGRKVKFGFLFSRPKNAFVYPESASEPIREGSIVFVDLSLLRGLMKMGVAFEITRLDESSKKISFCYLSDGKSKGSQEISFTEMADGGTKITHLTHYRSRSAFRDKELYPFFHARFVSEFHQNVLGQSAGGI